VSQPRQTSLTIARVVRTTLVLVLVLPFATMTGVTLWITDFASVGREISAGRWGFMVLGCAVFFLQYPVMALRWRLLLEVPAGPRPPVGEMTRLMFVAHLFDLVVPGPAGDLAVSYLLKVRRGLAMANASAAGAYGRVFGLISLATLPVVLAPLLTRDLPDVVERALDGGMVVALAAAGFMFALAIHPDGWGWLVRTLSRLIPRRWRESDRWIGRSIGGAMSFLSGFAVHARRIAATPARMAGAALLSLGVIAVNVLCLHLMLLGVHTALPLSWVAFAFCVQMVAQVAGYGIPGGGNVTSPVVCLAVLHGVMGVDEAKVVSVLFLSWAPNALACLVGLGIAMPNMSHISRSLQRSEEGEERGDPEAPESGART
jgi:hypothetical protein